MIELTNPSMFENFPRSYKRFSQDLVEEHKESTTNPCLPAVRSLLNSTSFSSRFVQETSSSAVSPEILNISQTWQDRGVSTLHLATVQVQQLAPLYTLREPIELVQFFRTHLSLVPLLIEVYHKVKLYLLDAQVFLQFVADSDSDNMEARSTNGDLVVSIVTQLSPADAVLNLQQFYEQWWLYTADEAQDKEKICFNLECV